MKRALHEQCSASNKRFRARLVFGESYDAPRYQLLKYSPEIFRDISKGAAAFAATDGASGPAGNADVRLVTAAKTYSLSLRDTSNQLLVVAPAAAGAAGANDENAENRGSDGGSAGSAPRYVVCGSAASVLEAEEKAPNPREVRDLMQSFCYGADGESDGPGGPAPGLRLADVCARVAISRAEALAALRAMGAVEEGGRWRGVREDALEEAMDAALLAVAANGFALDRVPVADLCAAAAAAGQDAFLVGHALRMLSEESVGGREKSENSAEKSESSAEKDENTAEKNENSAEEKEMEGAVVALDRAKIARLRARQLLRAAGERGWPRSTFLRRWKEAMPEESVAPPMEALSGLSVEVDGPEEDGMPSLEPHLRILDAAELPVDPKDRLRALFAVKAHWKKAEILPFLRPFGAEPQAMKLLRRLAKRAPQLETAGEPVFGAR